MKTNRFFAVLALTAAILASAGCKKDEPVKKITFPEAQTLQISIDETLPLVFEADADWKLTIDKQWLVFVDGEAQVSQISGVAGPVSLTLTTADVTSIFDEETATIDITMGTETQTLCTVTRLAEERTATMWSLPWSGEGEEITSLDFKYEWGSVSTAKVTFSANFDWVVKSIPDWMEGELFSGAAGDCDNQNYQYFGVKEEAYPYEKTGNIVISDQSGEHEITFPATFTGMGEEDILIRDGAKDVWSIAFSANHFVKTMGPSGMEESDRTSMDLSIMTRNMEYMVMPLEKKDPYGMGQMWFADPWQIRVDTDTPGMVKVSVEPDMAEGFEGYILIVPKALCPENPDDFGQSWFTKFENSDYMIKVTVDAPAATAGGFMLSWTRTLAKGEAVPFTSYDGFGGMKPSDFQYGLPDDNTYVYELPSEINGPLAMLPMGFPSNWQAGVSNGETVTYLFSASGEGFSSDKSNFDVAANIYESNGQSHMALSYSEAAMKAAPSMSFLIISFYQDMSELEMYKPSAALVLVKM
ncbi:MAG: hypothetical protein MR793_02060 [Bacteroidales bacterium]|nr:hypothetical protein [Bacteroidales bacterium]